MIQALLSGVSSIKAQQERMNQIGNNLANINTTAYKGSTVEFSDLLSETFANGSAPSTSRGGVNPSQIGLGVMIDSVDVNTSQGSLSATNRPTDLAIQGNGMFMVSDGTTVHYSRDGSFALDTNGNLVMRSNGLNVLGFAADKDGNINSSIAPSIASKVTIPIGGLSSASGTTKVELSGNLDGTLAATNSWSSQIRVYDAQGGAHDVTFVYNNRTSPAASGAPAGATSSWDWSAYEGTAATGTLVGSSATTGNAALYFDANGQPVNALGTNLNQITIPASPGAPAQKMGVDVSQVTQLKSASTAYGKSQDGVSYGSLTQFTIDQDGSVIGSFSNGQTRRLAQIAVANFQNPGGLTREGGNLWGLSRNSGTPMVGTANSGGRGSISSGYLEQSNVDITTEFTNMILTQRGYQANTKIVTTVDEMLQELLSLKR